MLNYVVFPSSTYSKYTENRSSKNTYRFLECVWKILEFILQIQLGFSVNHGPVHWVWWTGDRHAGDANRRSTGAGNLSLLPRSVITNDWLLRIISGRSGGSSHPRSKWATHRRSSHATSKSNHSITSTFAESNSAVTSSSYVRVTCKYRRLSSDVSSSIFHVRTFAQTSGCSQIVIPQQAQILQTPDGQTYIYQPTPTVQVENTIPQPVQPTCKICCYFYLAFASGRCQEGILFFLVNVIPNW